MKRAAAIDRRLWWAGGAMIVVAAAAAFLVPARDWTQLLEHKLEAMGLVQGLLIFCAAYVAGTLLFVPAWIFPIAAGAAFGWAWGFFAAVASSTLGALAAFLIARHLARGRVERAAKRNKTFKAVDQAVQKEPRKVVALLRLSPVLPSGAKSYFLGLTSVKPLDYTLASAVGMLPGLALKVWLGHAGRDALDGGPLEWTLLALGLTATIAMTLVVGKTVRRKLGL